jgi:isoquinoline 1-oxidoreductase beta subunit
MNKLPPINQVSGTPNQGTSPAFPSRRSFLIAVVETGIVLGFARAGRTASSGGRGEVMPSDLFEPTIWYSIDRNGLVTVNIICAEMGQHVGTALARIVADELEG